MSNVKNPDELFKILKAEALGDAAFNHILGFIQPGMTEIECADEIERFFLSHGAEGLRAMRGTTTRKADRRIDHRHKIGRAHV